MPYDSVSDLPDSVRGVLPAEAARQFMHVVNSQLDRGLSEERAFASAWATVKRRWKKGKDGTWVKKAMEETEADVLALVVEAQIAKADDVQQRLFGWASIAVHKDGTQLVDLQGDAIDIEDLEEAFYEYVKEAGGMNVRHDGPVRGVLIEAMVFTPEKIAALRLPPDSLHQGAWVGFHVPDRADYELIKSMKCFMFSIEGTGIREPYDAE